MSDRIPERYLEELQDLMDIHDYRYLPDWNQYRQRFPGGFRCVIMSATRYPEGTILEAHLGVRLDAVEEMVYPLLNGLAGFREHSMTLVTPLSGLFGESAVRELAQNRQDDHRLVVRIRDQLQRKGFSFLRQCSDLKALNELFNDQPRQKLALVSNQYYRCFRGIALAHLSGRTDVDKLAAIYRNQLFREGAIDPVRDKFERLVAFLQSYSPN